ncbi:MAG: patatin-like phospholipase family protein [Bellilinea sp.]
MKPFRKNVAIAIDGGGIRGLIVTHALSILEDKLGLPVHAIARLAAGTSTGSIIAAAIGSGMTAHELDSLYITLGPKVFPTTWRKLLFPLTRYKYPDEPLHTFLKAAFGEKRMGDYWISHPPTDVVITLYDLAENRNLFVKPWKDEYVDWPVIRAVQGSCTVPTYFPVVEGRYIDGGVGSYANPSYVAAYEARIILEWDPEETTLLSFGTGREPYYFDAHRASQFWPWDWLSRIFGVFMHSAEDQQVHLVETFFDKLDFRRFQVDLLEPIGMDDVDFIPRLVEYGEQMGAMILDDIFDDSMGNSPEKPAAKLV